MVIPQATLNHYKRMQQLQTRAVLGARRAWAGVDVDRLSESWAPIVTAFLVPVIAEAQEDAAAAGSAYAASTLAAQGVYEPPEHFVNPPAFAGVAADGRSLAGLLYSPALTTKRYVGAGYSPGQALDMGLKSLQKVTRTTVADAGRAAAGVDIATRVHVGYTRMLNPPSCKDCVILAGKYFRWNTGFDRHPHCDCVHVPTTDDVEGDTRTDPYEYFNSLDSAEQDRVFTPAGARAVRDGGDIFQVVNAKRGMKPGGLVTTEGTTRRGNYGAGREPRLTPEGIYSRNLPREQTLQLLERNGYILPGGQDPAGVIRGSVEGFGALGRGGTRVGARQAVLQARATGIRDPLVRATMTEAERRFLDAQLNWDAVSRGRNPFSRGQLTPELAAAVENDFRRIVLMEDRAAKITARQAMARN